MNDNQHNQTEQQTQQDLLKETYAEGVIDGFELGLARGMEKAREESALQFIQVIAEREKLSWKEAMDFLEIPQEERMALLQKLKQ